MQALVELAECHPEAIVLMRGRTFARICTEENSMSKCVFRTDLRQQPVGEPLPASRRAS